MHLSNDAINDEKRGLIYSARLKLNHATIRLEQKTVNLSPGMAVTAEIKTGKRRVIEYFLSPLMQYRDEACVNGSARHGTMVPARRQSRREI